MIEVIPLKYGTAFKRVFSQSEVFTCFAEDAFLAATIWKIFL